MNKQYKLTRNGAVPNIQRGGIAIPLDTNTFLLKGRKHKNGGIDIGKDLEAEGDEILFYDNPVKPNNEYILSAQKMLNIGGKKVSPAEFVLMGGDKNIAFGMQQLENAKHGRGDFSKRNKARQGLNITINDRDSALRRVGTIFNNYEDAIDNNMSNINTYGRKVLRYLQDAGLNPIGSGLSNCTLSASQWVNPNRPIMRAATIVEDKDKGFQPISAEYAIPGDLLITNNPDTGSYHTMIITGFDENNQPILAYSNGASNKKAIRKNITLNKYHKLDNEQSGNHKKDLYYRPLYENEVTLPEILVTPNKEKYGGKIIAKYGITYGDLNNIQKNIKINNIGIETNIPKNMILNDDAYNEFISQIQQKKQ